MVIFLTAPHTMWRQRIEEMLLFPQSLFSSKYIMLHTKRVDKCTVDDSTNGTARDAPNDWTLSQFVTHSTWTLTNLPIDHRSKYPHTGTCMQCLQVAFIVSTECNIGSDHKHMYITKNPPPQKKKKTKKWRVRVVDPYDSVQPLKFLGSWSDIGVSFSFTVGSVGGFSSAFFWKPCSMAVRISAGSHKTDILD